MLVLVDGRRWIKGSSGSGVSGAVDLNTIPVNAVKSIEILQDGASAVYGSDAIGGVLNIITQDDYEGSRFPPITASTTRATARPPSSTSASARAAREAGRLIDIS